MSHATPVVFVVDDATVRERLGAMIIFVGAPAEMPAMLQAMNAGADHSRAALGEESALRALRDRHALLSRREREVLSLVVSGRLNKQVGAELGISEVTVKAHRGQVMRKMGAASLPDLVRMHARLGLP